jgi:general L-amino acid transport system substrate-binding protein
LIFRIAVLALLLAAAHAQSPTVAAIRKAGFLICGIDQSEPEYSMTDEHGSRVAFDRDLCEAVAVAIFGEPHRSQIKGFPDEDTALTALHGGEVDVVPTVSDDFTHGTLPGIRLSRPILFDWKGFLVRHGLQARQLSGRRVCFLTETETEVSLRAWFAARHLDFVPFPFQEEGEMDAAFVTGNCAAIAGDATRLANTRAAFGRQASGYAILREVLEPDPLASAVRSDDEAFGNIVDWTYELLLLAEEQRVTAASVSRLKPGVDPRKDQLLDAAHALGGPLGLHDLWTVPVLRHVGNYGEIYRRNLGQPLDLPRLPNGLPPSRPLK